jgi:hypothetical protein
MPTSKDVEFMLAEANESREVVAEATALGQTSGLELAAKALAEVLDALKTIPKDRRTPRSQRSG